MCAKPLNDRCNLATGGKSGARWAWPLLLVCGAAQAAYFGGVESGMAEFENFSAAGGRDAAVAGSAIYGVVNLGGYKLLANERTAALAKLHVQRLSFNEQEDLNNNTAAGDFGLYHQFNARNSMVALAGARSVQFEDSRRDDTIIGGKLTYTLQFTPSFKFSTELHYDQGTVDTLSGRLTAYGASSTLGWTPHRMFAFNLGAARGVNEFAPPRQDAQGKAPAKNLETRAETSDSGWISLNLAFSKRWYLTGAMTLRQTSYDQDIDDTDGRTYSVGLGMKFF